MTNNNKKIFNQMVYKLNEISHNTLLSRLITLDYALLSLNHTSDASDAGLKYHNDFKIIPGYNKYFASLVFMTDFSNGKRRLNDDDMIFFSSKLDEMLYTNLKNNGISSVNAMSYAQIDWQRKYIFKTYLLFLFLQDNDINRIYKDMCQLNPIEVSGICLINKLTSELSIAKKLLALNIYPSQIVLGLKDYLYDKMQYISIDNKTYKTEQINRIIESNYDLFATRMMCKDYPIIKMDDGTTELISYFYIQNAIFSRTVHKVSDCGNNSKLIGDVFEKIVYSEMNSGYSNCSNDKNGNKYIIPNPSTKKSGELCDVLIKNGDNYLLIDCKAKEFIETLYSDSKSELDTMKKVYNQRFKRVLDVKNGKFDKYFVKRPSRENVYSLIAVTDDCNYSKSEFIKNTFDDIAEMDKEFCLKHIDFITYDDLLELIVANVDILSAMESFSLDERYKNPIAININMSLKSKYNTKYDNWYKDAINEATNKLAHILNIDL